MHGHHVAGAGPGGELPAIPGFTVHEQIGQGAMGIVYKATQTSLNRTVALKLLPTALADRQMFVARFYEETKALSNLNHPSIVTIIDRGNVGKTYYFVMEYVEGTPLSELCGKKLPTGSLLQIAESVCEGLRYAHARRLVHRDIKPSNIMLTKSGAAKVMDFGLVGVTRDGTDPASPSRRVMGTPGYMSPEQTGDAESVDGRSDIFSLGIVLYELVTGIRPDTAKHDIASQVSEQADPRLDPIIEKCLQLDPARRYQSAEDLLKNLRALRMELQQEPHCPGCGNANPVRSQTCATCSKDLSGFFDLCPDCGTQNRRDVRHCLECGVDLAARRAEVRARIDEQFERAFKLLYAESYNEAQQILKDVAQVKGNMFHEARMRAVALVKTINFGQKRMAKVRFRQAKQLFDAGQVRSAITLWEAIHPPSEEVKAVIQSARLHQANAEHLRRTRKTIIVLGIMLGLMAVVAAILSFI